MTAVWWREWRMLSHSLSVVALAIISRLVCVAYAVLSDLLIPDHEAEGVLLFHFPPECSHSNLLFAFTKWDSAHFLLVAEVGWEDPQRIYSHAFFPLYPLLIGWFSALLEPVFVAPSLLCTAELRVLVGMTLSNTAFVIAAWCLYRLGERVLLDPSLAHASACFFCAAPASVFFSTCYADASFAAATFGGLLLLELERPWLAALCLSLASSCRANGVLNVLPVVYASVRRLGRALDFHGVLAMSTPKAHKGERRQGRVTMLVVFEMATGLVQSVLVLAPYAAWQVIGHRRVCGGAQSSSDARSSFASLIVGFAVALRTVLTDTLLLFSSPGMKPTPTRVSRPASSAWLSANWCEPRALGGAGDRPWQWYWWSPPPDLYALVQREYWGVGLFRYYEFKQLPNFMLAAPVLMMWACATADALAVLRRRSCGLSVREAAHEALGLRRQRAEQGSGAGDYEDDKSKTKEGDGALTPRTLVYFLQWSALSLLSLLCANVQVTTRLVGAACPPVYWVMAHILLRRETRSSRWLGGRQMSAWVARYAAAYVVIGTALHSNGFPWT